MKSFLGGLALTLALALLSGTTTPQPAVCLLFPRFESPIVDVVDHTCRTACIGRVDR